MADTEQIRGVARSTRGAETSDGAGVNLRRLIGSPDLDMVDPFLMLDRFRSDDPTDYIAGFPPHPHRGFETVTYLLAGRMRHRDSTGREGVIESGGVQWMTAGRGIEHSEMPEQENGLLHGFQLWVNLPAERKMAEPRYQEYGPDALPIERRDGGVELRVVAGRTSHGTSGPISDIAVEPLYLDIELAPGAVFEEPVAEDASVFLYVIGGTLHVAPNGSAGQPVGEGELAVLGAGTKVVFRAGDTPTRLLLVAGRPIGEPVARYGPFVMNTREEVMQAFRDYQAGRFGRVAERS